MSKKLSLFAVSLLLLCIPKAHACEVGIEHFELLELKMRYADVVEIAGCDGEQILSSKAVGFRIDIYQWKSYGGVMRATFQSGRLIAKAQSGLR